MNLQENINRIKEVMGVLNEQTYMKSYSPANILDFCGYRAIEMFEETKGLPNGGPMKADYFEEKLASYETLISDNISKTIGMSTFNKFPPKLKMQIWSWMFNNTDAELGTVKWIAGLSQAINFNKFVNLQTKEYDKQKALEYRLKVSNQGSNEYKNAILEIKAFKGDWNTVYTNYLKVLDMQYISTANSNNLQGSYNNSWRYRPGDLDNLYNTCKSSTPKTQPTTTTPTNQQTPTTTITASSMKELRINLQTKTQNISIDPSSITFDSNNFSISFNPGNTKIKSMSIIFDDEGKLDDRIKSTILPKNPTMVIAQKDTSVIDDVALQWAIVYFT